MPADVSYIAEEDRLDLSFEGDLDLTVAQEICRLCDRLPPTLNSCIIDLSRVERLFDSGLALIQMLHRRLRETGTIVVIFSDSREVRRRLACLASCLFPPSEPPPQEAAR